MGEEEISNFSFIMGVTAGTHKLSDLVTVCKTWKKGGGVGIFHPGCFLHLYYWKEAANWGLLLK